MSLGWVDRTGHQYGLLGYGIGMGQWHILASFRIATLLTLRGAAFMCAGTFRFAKIKYILNGLSAGHDVVFLDTDIIVLQDPLPYFLGRGADMWAAHEKCVIWDDRANMLSLPPELQVNLRAVCHH